MTNERFTPRGSLISGITLLVLTLFSPNSLSADEAILAPPNETVRVPLLLRKLHTTHRALYVTAHPDDEDAGLISRLVHGEGIDLTLLTLTRGNGGQNEIGKELHGAIAALRTAELESAHRYDGATQWFGTADDFGYSFSVEETLENWGENRMLRELVGAIRQAQPDVIFTMSPDGTGGGQHHQASARLTERALHIAAEETWPELGPPHATARLFAVVWGDAEVENLCEVNLDRYDPLLGASYAEIGSRSRSMHKCQGMVTVDPPLPRRSTRLQLRYDRSGVLTELSHPFQDLPKRAFLDRSGNETTISRALHRIVDVMREGPFWETSPHVGSALALLRLDPLFARALRDAPNSAAMATLDRNRREAAQHSAGLRIQAFAASPFVGTDEEAAVTFAAENRGNGQIEVELWLEATGKRTEPTRWLLAPGERRLKTAKLPPQLLTTLLQGPVEGEIPARPAPIRLTGLAVISLPLGEEDINPPSQTLELVPIPVVARWKDEVFPMLRSTILRVVPDPSIRPARSQEVAIAKPDQPAVAHGEFRLSTRHAGDVEIELKVEDSRWELEPNAVVVQSPGAGIEVSVPFTVTSPSGFGDLSTTVRAQARRLDSSEFGEIWSRRGYRRIEYPHIGTTALEELAEVTVGRIEAQVLPKRVGYIEGVGDPLPRAMSVLGIEVADLKEQDLREGDLSRLDTIVVGVRAYKVRRDLRAAQGRLMEWIAGGGTLVVQYHKFEFNAEDGSSPYVPFRGAAVGRGRITDEHAPPVIQQFDHPLLTTPNQIRPRDWENWIQERGLYFLNVSPRAVTNYSDLILFEDPFPYNAGIRGGALVEAQYGKGRWIYVGLGLWRQTPAGVPGAYRLLANLLAR